jgi:NADH dehydrogenase FAD-containing subunit
MTPVASTTPRVVIIGGGFGGLYAARALRRAPVDVTLIDRRNYHLFQPLLYQVATAALNPSDIAAPIRRVLRRQRNCRVLLAEATAVDVAGKRVVLADGMLPYDFLIVATGATHSYFGHDEWERLGAIGWSWGRRGGDQRSIWMALHACHCIKRANPTAPVQAAASLSQFGLCSSEEPSVASVGRRYSSLKTVRRLARARGRLGRPGDERRR